MPRNDSGCRWRTRAPTIGVHHYGPNPQQTLSVPYGEGALERIVDHIRYVDPGLRHFTVAVVGECESFAAASALGEIPIDSPPPALFEPPVLAQVREEPKAAVSVQVFDASNPQTVSPFLESLHRQFYSATTYARFGVAVFFNPGVEDEQRVAGILPRRLFSGAPLRPSACVLGVSGNHLFTYSPEAAATYLAQFRTREGLCWTDGVTPAYPEVLLPYLAFPRHCFDQHREGDLTLDPPDEESSYWQHRIWTGGVSLPSVPHRIFDGSSFEHFRKLVHGTYCGWLCDGGENRLSSWDARPYSFARKRAYLNARFPRLRDWMNHCVIGTSIQGCASWDADRIRGSQFKPEPLSDFVINQDCDGTAIGDAVQLSHPNWLFNVVCDSFPYFETFFSVAAKKPVSPEIIRLETKNLLVEEGFLRAVLTSIGDDECGKATSIP